MSTGIPDVSAWRCENCGERRPEKLYYSLMLGKIVCDNMPACAKRRAGQ